MCCHNTEFNSIYVFDYVSDNLSLVCYFNDSLFSLQFILILKRMPLLYQSFYSVLKRKSDLSFDHFNLGSNNFIHLWCVWKS